MTLRYSETQATVRRALSLNAEVFTREALALLEEQVDPTRYVWPLLFEANRLRYVNAAKTAELVNEAMQHESCVVGTLVEITAQQILFLVRTAHAPLQEREEGCEHFRQRYKEIGFAFGDAVVDLQLGYAFMNNDRPDDALSLYQRALAKFEALDDELMSAETKSQIADALLIAGFDHGADEQTFEQSLQLRREVQEVYTRHGVLEWNIDVLHGISSIYFALNDFASSLTYVHQALGICERVPIDVQTDDQRMQTTMCLSQIGMIHAKARNLDAARQYSLLALEVCPLSHHEARRDAFERLGVIEIWDGNAERALDYYQQAVALVDEHNITPGAVTQLNIAHCLLALGRVNEARTAYDVAVRSGLAAGHHVQAWAAIIKAQILVHDNAFDEAKVLVEDCLQRYFAEPNIWEQIEAHLVLRTIAQHTNDFAQYIHHNERVTTLTDQLRGAKKLQGLTSKEHERSVEIEREEARRHKAILYSTLPKHIADRVVRGEEITDHIETASVFFLDIVGFTTLSGTLTSQQVNTLLEAVFGACDAACARNGVTRIKTIGDSYMAFSN